jgi:hypothetical protein
MALHSPAARVSRLEVEEFPAIQITASCFGYYGPTDRHRLVALSEQVGTVVVTVVRRSHGFTYSAHSELGKHLVKMK